MLDPDGLRMGYICALIVVFTYITKVCFALIECALV